MNILALIIEWGLKGLSYLADFTLWLTTGLPLLHNGLEMVYSENVTKNKFMVKFSQLALVNVTAMFITSWFTRNPVIWLTLGFFISMLGAFAREAYDESKAPGGFCPRDIVAGIAQALFIAIAIGSMVM